jgi:hypothetical protein
MQGRKARRIIMSSSPSKAGHAHDAFFILKSGKDRCVVKSDSSDALEASNIGNNALLFQLTSASEDSDMLVLLQTLGGRMQVVADPSEGVRLQDSSQGPAPFLKVPVGEGFAFRAPDKQQWLSVSADGKLGLKKQKIPGASETFTTEILASAYRHDCCGPSLEFNAKWNDLGHSTIVEKGIERLRKQIGDTPEAKAFIEMLDSDGSLKEMLMQGLYDADYEDALRDKQRGIPYWSSHFYDPDTRQNYWKDGSPTALERGRDFFRASLRVLQIDGGNLKFRIGRRSGGGSLHFKVEGATRGNMAQASFKMLGIALHYFTDLSQPMHASNVANIYGKDVRYPQPTDFRHSGFEEQGDEKVKELFQNYAPLTLQQMDVHNINNVEQLYEDMARASKNVWLRDVRHLFDEKLVLPPPPPPSFDNRGPEPIQLPISLPWGNEETQPALEHSLKLAPIRVAQFLLYWTHLAMKRSWLDWAKYDGTSSPACGVNKGGQVFSLSKPNAAGDTVPRFLSEPKFARDIAVGRDGTVWVVSNKKLPGGYAIYYLADGTNNRWVEIKPPVSATKIAVTRDGTAIIVNEAGTVWAINRPNAAGEAGGRQLSEAGFAQEISVGLRGSIWAISRKERKGGFVICYCAKGKPWVELQAPAAAVKIAAAPNGSAWVINDAGAVFSLSKPDAAGKYVGKEHPDAGFVQEISVGQDSSVWTISHESRTRGFAPYYLHAGILRKKKWVQIKGPVSATKIAVL